MERNLIEKKIFTYYINKENGGQASFGEIMKNIVTKEENINYSNVENINDEA